jgi:hypothetical protein
MLFAQCSRKVVGMCWGCECCDVLTSWVCEQMRVAGRVDEKPYLNGLAELVVGSKWLSETVVWLRWQRERRGTGGGMWQLPAVLVAWDGQCMRGNTQLPGFGFGA